MNHIDVDTEQRLLGALLQGGVATLSSVAWLPETDLGSPVAGAILRACRSCADHAPDTYGPAAVASQLRHDGVRMPASVKPEAILGELFTRPDAIIGQIPHYADRIAGLARRRTLTMRAQRIQRMCESEDEETLDRVRSELTSMIEDTDLPHEIRVDGLFLASTFVNMTSPDDAWVLPGLLAEQERVIVVAPEKSGKTILAYQVAVLAAMGKHPFVPLPMPPIRTLVIDLENGRKQIRDTLWNQYGLHGGVSVHVDAPVHLWWKPDGLNLGSRRDVLALKTVVESVRPQLVCFGPVYKASDPRLPWEEQARQVTDVIDEIRAATDTAWWMEHHAPVEESNGVRRLRPLGGSVWLKWPDFLMRLVPDSADPPYRRLQVQMALQRIEGRDWPSELTRGTSWGWEACWQHGIPMHLRPDEHGQGT